MSLFGSNPNSLPAVHLGKPARKFFSRQMSEIKEDLAEPQSPHRMPSDDLQEPDARAVVIQQKREETLEAAVALPSRSSVTGSLASQNPAQAEGSAPLSDEQFRMAASAAEYLLGPIQDAVSLRRDICRCLQKYSPSTRSAAATEELEGYLGQFNSIHKDFTLRHNLVSTQLDQSRYPGQFLLVQGVAAKYNRLMADIEASIVDCAKRLFSICTADIMDESFSRFLVLCHKHRTIINTETLLNCMKAYMLEKAETNTLRESVQSLHGESFQTVCERYHTLLAKLKRNKSLTLTLVQSMEQYLSDFEFSLKNSIPNGVSCDHLIAGEPALVNISVVQNPYKRDLKTQNEDDRPGNKSFADFGPTISPAITQDDTSRYLGGFDKTPNYELSYQDTPEQTRKNSSSQRQNNSNGLQGLLFSNSHSTGKLNIGAVAPFNKAATNSDMNNAPPKFASHLGPARPSQENSEYFIVNPGKLKPFMAHPEDIHNLQILMSVMLSQIDQKVQTATKWVAVHESLNLGVVQVLKSINTPQIKTYFQRRKREKEVFLSRLARTVERSLAKSLAAISDKDVTAIYSLVGALYHFDKKIIEFLVGLPIKDRSYFFNLHNDSVFAFSLSQLVSVVSNLSTTYYDKAFKASSYNLLELDLFDVELTKTLKEGLTEEFTKTTFFKEYKDHLAKHKFFKSEQSPNHFMVPFQMLVVDQLKPSHKGAILWAFKTVLQSLLSQVCKKKKFVSFLGYLSLVLNINALVEHVLETIPDYNFK